MAVCLQGARKGGPVRGEAQGLSARPEGRGGPRRRRGGEGQARGDGGPRPQVEDPAGHLVQALPRGRAGCASPQAQGQAEEGALPPLSRGELEARVRELELELEIQKRINALADEIGQGRRTR